MPALACVSSDTSRPARTSALWSRLEDRGWTPFHRPIDRQQHIFQATRRCQSLQLGGFVCIAQRETARCGARQRRQVRRAAQPSPEIVR